VIVNNMPVGTVITPASSSYATYTTSTTFIVAQGGTTTITLEGTDPSGGDNTAFVTNVMILASENS
jgi:FlaG/FlaF family flagellin (archaellin)